MEVTGVEVDGVGSGEGARRGEVSAEWGMVRERRLWLAGCAAGGVGIRVRAPSRLHRRLYTGQGGAGRGAGGRGDGRLGPPPCLVKKVVSGRARPRAR